MIELNESFIQEIQRQAEGRYPNECCGIIIGTFQGDTKKMELLYPAENKFEQDERYHRYRITPEEYREADRLAASRKLDIIGLYHSHPDHPARPSQFDLDHAWGWFSYIIMNVTNGKAGAMHSWVLNGDRSGFNEERISYVMSQKEEKITNGNPNTYTDTPSALH